MNWYSESKDTVIKELMTNAGSGLTAEEAVERLGKNGPNRLAESKRRSLLRRILDQLSDFMIIILIVAAFLSFMISKMNGEADYIDPIIIMAIIAVNTTMGIIQESKADRAIDALKKLSSPKSRVVRSGILETIDSEDVVEGDIILYEAGDMVTADARLIEAYALKTEESSLTGESMPVEKAAFDSSSDSPVREGAALGERINMVYAGSTVVSGRCRAVVTATGMNTEMGGIARLIDSSESPDTPLQKRLASIGRILGIAAIAICAVIFIFGVMQKNDILDSFMLSVSLAVAAVPEGLPAIVTIVLALGVQRMAAKNAIIRKLPAVETLGSATVICSDKTGTLTQNKMSVQRLVMAEDGTSAGQREKLLKYGMLCTNSTVQTVDGRREITGESTENAIVEAAENMGIHKRAAEAEYVRFAEIPFDSGRKLMTTLHKTREGRYLSITKGAPDVLIKRCAYYDCGRVARITPAAREKMMRLNDEMAGKALRVIAVAYRELNGPPGNLKSASVERELTFLGFIAMIDPPRPEVKEAVRLCKRAGIRPIMITGDHAATAAAIARELGIAGMGREVVTGPELEDMSDSELKKAVKRTAVFARVSPEHKSRIVKALQQGGEVVAMTGDGVNDAPALKAADIGCAMGESGTDVARNASDMVLTDDNFSTIVAAVEEGRGIYDNICKTVHFLLSCNIGEILTIFIASLMGNPSPLLPIQLLWVNLVTDSLPALALGSEKADHDIMYRKPIERGAGMFVGGRGIEVLWQGLLVGALSLTAYILGARQGGIVMGRTFAFATLSLSQLVHAFNVRSEKSLFKIGFFGNRQMNISFLVCLVLQVSVICIPAVAGIFSVTPLTLGQWGQVALLSLVPLVMVEINKLQRSSAKKREVAQSLSPEV